MGIAVSTAVDLSICMTLVSVIGLLSLVYFVLYWETWKRDRPWTMRTIATPFNRALALIIASSIGVHLFEIFLLRANTPRDWDIFNLIQTFFTTHLELGYVIYSWERGGPVAENLYPTSHKHFQRLVRILPFLLYLPLIPQVAIVICDFLDMPTRGNDSYFVLGTASTLATAIPALLIFALDLYLLSAFIKFMKTTSTHESGQIDKKFLIISQYGSVAIVIWLTGFILFAADTFATCFTCFVLVLGMFDMLFLVLFIMKIQLYREERRKEASDALRLTLVAEMVKQYDPLLKHVSIAK